MIDRARALQWCSSRLVVRVGGDPRCGSVLCAALRCPVCAAAAHSLAWRCHWPLNGRRAGDDSHRPNPISCSEWGGGRTTHQHTQFRTHTHTHTHTTTIAASAPSTPNKQGGQTWGGGQGTWKGTNRKRAFGGRRTHGRRSSSRCVAPRWPLNWPIAAVRSVANGGRVQSVQGAPTTAMGSRSCPATLLCSFSRFAGKWQRQVRLREQQRTEGQRDDRQQTGVTGRERRRTARHGHHRVKPQAERGQPRPRPTGRRTNRLPRLPISSAHQPPRPSPFHSASSCAPHRRRRCSSISNARSLARSGCH